MEENVYRAARKKAAERNPVFKNLDKTQDVVYIDRSRLLKIENGTKAPNPDDIVSMAKCYDAPELCNYYCSHECPIGCNNEALIFDDLDKISVRLMSALHFLENSKDKIYAILEDGKIAESEREEFEKILNTLGKISYSAGSLELWAKKNGFEE